MTIAQANLNATFGAINAAGTSPFHAWSNRFDALGSRTLGRRTRGSSSLDPAEMPVPLSGITPIVFVVDGDNSARESLELLIRSAGWRAETFPCAEEFLANARLPAPSCLLLDMKLPGLSGLELQRRIAVERTDMPIIFITGHADVPMTVQAMKAGAQECFVKPHCDEVLLKAIADAVARSRTALHEEAGDQILRDRHRTLSVREMEVMALVVSGLLNKQVGGELGISEITVKAHRGNAMRKMKADSLATLVTMAARLAVVLSRSAISANPHDPA